MSRFTRVSKVIIAVIGGVLLVGAVSLGILVAVKGSHKAQSVQAAASSTAFTLRSGALPKGWTVAASSPMYLNLGGPNGCFTTAAATVRVDYDSLTSLAQFIQTYGPRFTQNGYTLQAAGDSSLTSYRSGVPQTSYAVAYQLAKAGAVTYHIDAGILGKNGTAFMSIACTDSSQLQAGRTALLAVDYNDTYRLPQ